MTSRLNLPSRRLDIRAAAQLATIKSCDKLGRVRAVEVPGHHEYRLVLLSRQDSMPSTIIAECLMQTKIGMIPCIGNGQHSVCYHALSGIKVAAEECGARVIGWFADKKDAKRALNLRQFRGCHVGRTVPKVAGRIKEKSAVWFLWKSFAKQTSGRKR